MFEYTTSYSKQRKSFEENIALKKEVVSLKEQLLCVADLKLQNLSLENQLENSIARGPNAYLHKENERLKRIIETHSEITDREVVIMARNRGFLCIPDTPKYSKHNA